MAGNVFSLGNVIAQGEAIKGARYARDPSNPQNRLRELQIMQAENALNAPPKPQYSTVVPGSSVFDERTGQIVYSNPKEPKQDPLIAAFTQAQSAGLVDPGMKFMDFVGAYKKPLVDMSTGEPMPSSGVSDRAKELGVPQADTPWGHIRSQKAQDAAKQVFLRDAMKRGEEMGKGAKNSRNMVRDIQRFLHLNETNYTGAGMGILGAKTIRKGLDPEFGEMTSIVDKMTPQMRQGMPGSASNLDVTMFRGATVGSEQTPEANKNIGQALIIANQNQVDMAQFHSDFVAANKHDIGWESAWNEYLESNPIFDPDAPDGSYVLNPNRKTWKQHFHPEETQSMGRFQIEVIE